MMLPDTARDKWGCWKTRNAQERNGTEPEVIDAQLTWTLDTWPEIRTVFVSVRTRILRSVTAANTGQAQAESHVKRMKLLR